MLQFYDQLASSKDHPTYLTVFNEEELLKMKTKQQETFKQFSNIFQKDLVDVLLHHTTGNTPKGEQKERKLFFSKTKAHQLEDKSVEETPSIYSLKYLFAFFLLFQLIQQRQESHSSIEKEMALLDFMIQHALLHDHSVHVDDVEMKRRREILE